MAIQTPCLSAVWAFFGVDLMYLQRCSDSVMPKGWVTRHDLQATPEVQPRLGYAKNTHDTINLHTKLL